MPEKTTQKEHGKKTAPPSEKEVQPEVVIQIQRERRSFANCADLDSAPPSERWQPRERKAGAARRWRAALIYEKTLSIFQKTSPGGASQSKNALIG